MTDRSARRNQLGRLCGICGDSARGAPSSSARPKSQSLDPRLLDEPPQQPAEMMLEPLTRPRSLIRRDPFGPFQAEKADLGGHPSRRASCLETFLKPAGPHDSEPVAKFPQAVERIRRRARRGTAAEQGSHRRTGGWPPAPSRNGPPGRTEPRRPVGCDREHQQHDGRGVERRPEPEPGPQIVSGPHHEDQAEADEDRRLHGEEPRAVPSPHRQGGPAQNEDERDENEQSPHAAARPPRAEDRDPRTREMTAVAYSHWARASGEVVGRASTTALATHRSHAASIQFHAVRSVVWRSAGRRPPGPRRGSAFPAAKGFPAAS